MRPRLVKRRTILILEDSQERIRAFEGSVGSLGPDFSLRWWCDVPTLISECSDCLRDASLISVRHNLAPLPASFTDPGTGLVVAKFLSMPRPSCPVILHTSHHERRRSMHNELRSAGGKVEIVGDSDIQPHPESSDETPMA